MIVYLSLHLEITPTAPNDSLPANHSAMRTVTLLQPQIHTVCHRTALCRVARMSRSIETQHYWGDGPLRLSLVPAIADIPVAEPIPRARPPRRAPVWPTLGTPLWRTRFPCPYGDPVSYKPGDFFNVESRPIILSDSLGRKRAPRSVAQIVASEWLDAGAPPPPPPGPPAIPPLRDPAGPLTVGWRAMKDA